MPDYFIGLLSGTSMDGIDAALVDFSVHPPRLAGTLHRPWPDSVRMRLLSLAEQRRPLSLTDYGELDARLGEGFADAVLALLEQTGVAASAVTAIGSHGQTVQHRPLTDPPFSLQIGDPNRIVEKTGITTVADFRRRDIAAGGQGAPLVPAFHRFLFAEPTQSRAVLNLGGMANLTLLGEPLTGFDTGPGNVLLDAWCQTQFGEPFDAGGEHARAGRVNRTLLAQLLEEPYFSQAAPKSTGREQFNIDWLQGQLARFDAALEAQDVQATLVALTVQSIADALMAAAPATQRLLVCGGGARNLCLMESLARALPDTTVETSEVHGLHPDWVEAVAFAWLAKRTLEGLPGNVPSVTGAAREVVLGAVYPA